MRIHGKTESSTVNGPGNRAVIWVQGCEGMNCAGCWNPETHDPKAGKTTALKTLVEWVISLKDIDGLSISGGEPLQQYGEVYALMADLKDRIPYLSIGMFTGYSSKELCKRDYRDQQEDGIARIQYWRSEYWVAMQRYLDFAVMGRFNQGLVQLDHSLISSSNQELVLFTDRYKKEDFEPKTVYEVLIQRDGTQTKTGFPISKWEFLLDRVD